jgi:predicted aspartyl protease
MDEIYNQCIDLALTDTLENISQFAPTLLRTKKDIKVDGEKVTTNLERPTIKIENVKIEKKRGQTVIEEDY